MALNSLEQPRMALKAAAGSPLETRLAKLCDTIYDDVYIIDTIYGDVYIVDMIRYMSVSLRW